VRFEAVLRGSLKRHAQTLAGIQDGLMDGDAAAVGQEAAIWPGLNEYDSEAVIASVHAGPHAKPVTPEAYREHFHLLRTGLLQWASGAATPQGMPAYRDFVQGVVAALDHVRAQYTGNVLLVSSGGPIATAVAQLLAAGPDAFVELNMRLRNTAVSEFVFKPKRHVLLSFNTLPHLDAPAYADWQSYA
jgi:hypothetical protein